MALPSSKFGSCLQNRLRSDENLISALFKSYSGTKTKKTFAKKTATQLLHLLSEKSPHQDVATTSLELVIILKKILKRAHISKERAFILSGGPGAFVSLLKYTEIPGDIRPRFYLVFCLVRISLLDSRLLNIITKHNGIQVFVDLLKLKHEMYEVSFRAYIAWILEYWRNQKPYRKIVVETIKSSPNPEYADFFIAGKTEANTKYYVESILEVLQNGQTIQSLMDQLRGTILGPEDYVPLRKLTIAPGLWLFAQVSSKDCRLSFRTGMTAVEYYPSELQLRTRIEKIDALILTDELQSRLEDSASRWNDIFITSRSNSKWFPWFGYSTYEFIELAKISSALYFGTKKEELNKMEKILASYVLDLVGPFESAVKEKEEKDRLDTEQPDTEE